MWNAATAASGRVGETSRFKVTRLTVTSLGAMDTTTGPRLRRDQRRCVRKEQSDWFAPLCRVHPS